MGALFTNHYLHLGNLYLGKGVGSWTGPASALGHLATLLAGNSLPIARSTFDRDDLDPANAEGNTGSLLPSPFDGENPIPRPWFGPDATGARTVFAGPSDAFNPLVDVSGALGPRTILAVGAGLEIELQQQVGLADADWNGVKLLELASDDADLRWTFGMELRNFVDVRLKLGSAAPYADDGGHPLVLDIENAKRGQIDAQGMDWGFDLRLTLASNAVGGDNAFHILGSDFEDRVVLARGDNTAIPLTIGKTLDLTGRWTLAVVDLGAGDDVFSAAGTRATTVVAGGQDGGSLFAGARLLTLGYGGDDLMADWAADAAAAGLPGAIPIASVGAGSLSARQVVPRQFGTATDFHGNAVPLPAAEFFPESAVVSGTEASFYGPVALPIGIGVGTFIGNSPGTGNAEVNEYITWDAAAGRLVKAHDELAIRLGADAIAVRIDLTLFYSDEFSGRGEVAKVELWNDGQLAATAIRGAENDTAQYSPVDVLASVSYNLGRGHFVITAAELGIAAFDEVRLVGYQPDYVGARDSNDYLLYGIKVVLAGSGVAVLGGDRLTAGLGKDTFRYDAARGDGVDTILDFTPGQDRLAIAGVPLADIAIETWGSDTLIGFAGQSDAAILVQGVTGLSVIGSSSGDILIG